MTPHFYQCDPDCPLASNSNAVCHYVSDPARKPRPRGLGVQLQFDQLATDITTKVLAVDTDQGRKNATGFLKVLLKMCGAHLDSDNLRELSSSLTVVLNEKIRDEASGKKKKSKAVTPLKTLKVDNNNSTATNDDANDYDFM